MIDQTLPPAPDPAPLLVLWPYERFSSAAPAIRRRTFERMSAQGTFPKFCRLTPRSAPLWAADQVERWLSDKYATLTAEAMSPDGDGA